MGTLTDRTVKAAKKGRHVDGKGLLLLVRESSTTPPGCCAISSTASAATMAWASEERVKLADAREKALEARRLIRKDHKDPIEIRQAERLERQREKAAAMSFKQCADLYIAAHEPSWRNPKHRQQWRQHVVVLRVPHRRRSAGVEDEVDAHRPGDEDPRAALERQAGDRRPCPRPDEVRARLGRPPAAVPQGQESGPLEGPSGPPAAQEGQDLDRQAPCGAAPMTTCPASWPSCATARPRRPAASSSPS